MLTAVVCSLLCVARGYEGLVEWLHDLPVDIWHGMGFTRRPPKKDAFRDLLIKLDPAELDRVLQRWVVTDLGLPDETQTLAGISIDGKCRHRWQVSVLTASVCAPRCDRMPRRCICWPQSITRPGAC